MEKLDLVCHETYCWEACKWFKDLSEKDFEFGIDYITLSSILMKVF